MKKLLKAMFVVFIVFIGCATTRTPRMIAERNNENLLKLKIGMAPRSVKKTMGAPDFHESYLIADGKTTSVWFYYTRSVDVDEIIMKDECTRLLFENGRLAWIGK